MDFVANRIESKDKAKMRKQSRAEKVEEDAAGETEGVPERKRGGSMGGLYPKSLS